MGKLSRRARRKAGPRRCPECGTEVGEPYKTWELVAPIPDRKMRITITVMGMFQCPNCGKKFRAVVSKIKVGPEGAEVG
ncbi:MAG TPA: chromatin protein Cren7 [Candidatus Bathyarchaeota archaeon]|nr:chromatin protein Cren7 [Candidatus Bathyarchaeota archaeon]